MSAKCYNVIFLFYSCSIAYADSNINIAYRFIKDVNPFSAKHEKLIEFQIASQSPI